jgi:hypothetical protein
MSNLSVLQLRLVHRLQQINCRHFHLLGLHRADRSRLGAKWAWVDQPQSFSLRKKDLFTAKKTQNLLERKPTEKKLTKAKRHRSIERLTPDERIRPPEALCETDQMDPLTVNTSQ